MCGQNEDRYNLAGIVFAVSAVTLFLINHGGGGGEPISEPRE